MTKHWLVTPLALVAAALLACAPAQAGANLALAPDPERLLLPPAAGLALLESGGAADPAALLGELDGAAGAEEVWLVFCWQPGVGWVLCGILVILVHHCHTTVSDPVTGGIRRVICHRVY